MLLPTKIETAVLTPSEIPDGPPRQVRQLVASVQTSAAVTVDGRLFAWGIGAYYTLGLGTMDNVCMPTEVQMLRYARVTQVTADGRVATV